MMHEINIEKEWREFERDVLPPKAGPIQRKEMRRAFYAGAVVILGRLPSIAELDEDDGMETLENLFEQCREFARRETESSG